MHFIVTARITPFSPGASPPPVSIPTLRTSAIGSSFVQRCETLSLAKPLRENARRSAERGVDRKGERGQHDGLERLSPSGPPEEPVAVLGGFGVALDQVRVQVHEPDLRYPLTGVEWQLQVSVGGKGGVCHLDQELH